MPGGSDDDVERIERALPGVDVMAEDDGADLNQSGTEYRCDHPHHTTPSSNGENLCISAEGETWHCKRHDHGGGKLSWVAMSEGICQCGDLDGGRIPSAIFRDVLEVAADRAGVELEGSGGSGSDERTEKLDRFDDARQQVAEFYHRCLDIHGMRAELKDRYGFSDELIDENLIGYAPEPGMAHDLPDETGIGAELLQRLGVWRESGAPHFQDRFVFPYFALDAGDRKVRYFTARAVDHDGGPKYLKIAKNDSVDSLAGHEPPFGIDTLRGAQTVVVAEGVTDALTLHDHGIAAVSPVTTHISGDALEMFARRLRGKDVFVVYDEDAGTDAGIQGASTDAYTLKEEHVDARVARLPSRPNESIDVNEWFCEGGTADEFRDEVLDGTFPAKVAWWAWGKGRPHHLFSAAVEELGEDPRMFKQKKDDEGDVYYESVRDVLEGVAQLDNARRKFYAGGQTALDAAIHKECYHHIIRWVFTVRGEFFRTESGEVLYFYRPDNKVVQVTKQARPGETTAEFAHMVERVLGISTADWGRSLINTVGRHFAFTAPERPVASLTHYDEAEGELYLNRFDGHYYALDGDDAELRRNGTDVFFRSKQAGEPFEYLEPDERATLPDAVPGERHPFTGSGDLIERLIANRINYDEAANLAPTLQRAQLYLHLHAMAFVTEFDGRPIMAWVGQKGSGKTMVLRSIGQFLYGPEWRESTMPSDEDNFVTKVSNRTLAAIDNYDDDVGWANDYLASIATGASIEKRELYTTDELRQAQPECWLALTSRDPPFRRDDVADRCLVFRVARVEGDFISETQYLRQIRLYRDDLWSEFMDNLNEILRVRQQDADPHRTTSHRMADWALFARDAAEALGVSEVDDLLDGMQTERAFFALENEPLRLLIESFLREHPDGGEWEASELLDKFERASDDAGVPLTYSTSRGLSNALSSLSDELGELFGLEVVDPRNGAKRYRFPGAGEQGMLGYDFPGGDPRGEQ